MRNTVAVIATGLVLSIVTVSLRCDAPAAEWSVYGGLATFDVVLGGGPDRIVHILNYHFVDDELFARSQGSTVAATEEQYAQLLSDVIDVQSEQRLLLTRLAADGILREVFVEGWTDEEASAFRDMARRVWRGRSDDEQPEPWEDPLLIWKLDLGAAGRLEAEDVLRILPAETTALVDAALPVTADGQYRGILDEAHEAREDAMVRRMVERGGTQFIILGQGHDLSDNIRRLTSRRVGYFRVRVPAVR